jgi:DNA polymerase-3 subunit alpha
MPDIDSDFPSGKRDQIIEYVRTKYGDEHVAQMATFAELQGREAITAVLRAHSWGSFEDRKKVTAAIPDKAAISDELQDMMEEEGEASSIRWTLENKPDALREYCTLNEDGTLEGPLAAHFEQAMRLEGNKKSQGRHPSGIVISPTPLRDEVPMVYDKSTKRMVTGFDMHGVEAAGILKFDILATRASDKILDACVGARTGRVS